MEICIHFGAKEIGISGLEVIPEGKRLFNYLHLPLNADKKNDRKDLPEISGRGGMDHLQHVLLTSDAKEDYFILSTTLIPWRKPWDSSEATVMMYESNNSTNIIAAFNAGTPTVTADPIAGVGVYIFKMVNAPAASDVNYGIMKMTNVLPGSSVTFEYRIGDKYAHLSVIK